MERPRRSTTYFEKIDVSRRYNEPLRARLKELADAGFAINFASLIAYLSVGDGPEAWGPWAARTGALWGLTYFFRRRVQATR